MSAPFSIVSSLGGQELAVSFGLGARSPGRAKGDDALEDLDRLASGQREAVEERLGPSAKRAALLTPRYDKLILDGCVDEGFDRHGEERRRSWFGAPSRHPPHARETPAGQPGSARASEW
jgi:hypothetical protein